jgi:hypothetical protein
MKKQTNTTQNILNTHQKFLPKKEKTKPFNMFKTTTKTIKSLPKTKLKQRGEEK